MSLTNLIRSKTYNTFPNKFIKTYIKLKEECSPSRFKKFSLFLCKANLRNSQFNRNKSMLFIRPEFFNTVIIHKGKTICLGNPNKSKPPWAIFIQNPNQKIMTYYKLKGSKHNMIKSLMKKKGKKPMISV